MIIIAYLKNLMNRQTQRMASMIVIIQNFIIFILIIFYIVNYRIIRKNSNSIQKLGKDELKIPDDKIIRI
jgi:hypothetical protein